MNNKCEYCKHLTEQHYEKEGEKPYIKYVCGNRFGISDYSQVIPEMDFCSRFEEKEQLVKIGDEVIVNGCKGIIVREPYQIGRSDDPLSLVLVWYGCYMGDVELKEVQPTGKEYPEIVKIMEELKKYEEEEV